jgi:hypothetical protein
MKILYNASKHEGNTAETKEALITIYVHPLARKNMVLGGK